MLKILLAHNYYGSAAPSGENQVFETEVDLLRARGHTRARNRAPQRRDSPPRRMGRG